MFFRKNQKKRTLGDMKVIYNPKPIKVKANCFKQAVPLSYELIGTIQDNGTTYVISKTEADFNFDGEGNLPTIAFRVRTENDDSNDCYALAFRKDNNINFISEDMPNGLGKIIFEDFILPHSEKIKHIN
ncbi:MAG: hypothetical protein GTN36_06255 [Candidatus Aenigmarchaeota archaeon]|nr:hypothetical protein [Candidatus Aenigmarchaeota archaeon]